MAEGKDLAVVGMVLPPECCKTARFLNSKRLEDYLGSANKSRGGEVNEAYWHFRDGWPEQSLHRSHSFSSW